jgi:hypothetical protein
MGQRRQSKEVWSEVMSLLDEYPGTQADFCRDQGITLSSLRYHLARRGGYVRADSELSESSFIAVGLIGEGLALESGNGSQCRGAIEIAVGAIRLQVWPGTDMALLGQVLKSAVDTCGRT